ncbi:MAG: pirin family protein [Candidatus Melainabacteria bacterium]|nr:pirin family protein [Candidatus Melainabacteria bacterium]
MKKNIVSVHRARAPHMVGDGLPVRNVFSYTDLGKRELSPFLMLDYGMPSQFKPTEEILGVGMHPHRGFETVTLAFQGRLQHRDTAGNHGEIGPGDVQWMTAGSGVLHEELHAPAFRKSGGTLQMLQLWVNLPAELKMTQPRYQTLENADIPVVEIGAARVRVISGLLGETHGPANTFTPINLWDVQLGVGEVHLSVPKDYTTALFVMEGKVTVNGEREVEDSTIVVLEEEGTDILVSASANARFIVLNGQPIDEAVVGYGPFVMNTQEQIAEAMKDYSAGRFAGAKR